MRYEVVPFPGLRADGSLQTFLANARSQLPFVEGPDNKTPYPAIVGHREHEPWCMSFLCAVAKVSGVKLPMNTASTLSMANAFRQQGRWGSTPRVGAFGFIHIKSLGRIGHVFTVEAVRTLPYVVSIEGNTDVRGGRTGGRVMRHVRGVVVGYGYPIYTSVTLPRPRVDRLLRRGMGPSQDILNVQNAMHKIFAGNVFPRPGYFDSYTERVISNYQRNRGMAVTGRVDAQVWERLRLELKG